VNKIKQENVKRMLCSGNTKKVQRRDVLTLLFDGDGRHASELIPGFVTLVGNMEP